MARENKLRKHGFLIAGVGLPASGKSTLLRTLGEKHKWKCYVEPEEHEWATAVNGRSMSGVFTALTWFRSIRVPNLYAADALRQNGQIVIVDSYYDKLMSYYFGKPQMDWLIDSNDPYYELMEKMAQIDNEQLPAADLLVFLKVSFDSWRDLIASRKRQSDLDWIFPKAFPFQDYLLEAVHLESQKTGCQLLIFENKLGSVNEMVKELQAAIVKFIPSNINRV